jgi:hypothetical protein
MLSGFSPVESASWKGNPEKPHSKKHTSKFDAQSLIIEY